MLTITDGPTDHQVVQCNDAGHAALTLAGASEDTGTVETRVCAVQKVLVDWTPSGEAKDGAWSASIPEVPAGGPYRIDVRVGGAEASVHDVLVGDVWVLAGQSNMQGCGNQVDMETPHPQVHTFAMSYEWRLAQEPLHTLHESPDPVHHDPALSDEERANAIVGWREGPKGTGLGLTFAKEMLGRTGRPVGLIAAAHGGTSMEQWNPALKDEGGNSLYGSMCNQVAAAGGKVRGVLWYQGESDTVEDAPAVFAAKFAALIEAMRKDFENPELPFYYVQIGRVVAPWPVEGWNKVQADQLAAEAAIAHTGMVAAVDLDIDDLIHIGTPGLKVLGKRLANLAEAGLYGGAILPGPRLASLKREGDHYGLRIRATFTGVNGALEAAGRLSGFSLSGGAEGPDTMGIFKVTPAQDDPNALLIWVSEFPEDCHLWYGRGTDPYCNIVDSANMALPVFGPVAVPE